MADGRGAGIGDRGTPAPIAAKFDAAVAERGDRRGASSSSRATRIRTSAPRSPPPAAPVNRLAARRAGGLLRPHRRDPHRTFSGFGRRPPLRAAQRLAPLASVAGVADPGCSDRRGLQNEANRLQKRDRAANFQSLVRAEPPGSAAPAIKAPPVRTFAPRTSPDQKWRLPSRWQTPVIVIISKFQNLSSQPLKLWCTVCVLSKYRRGGEGEIGLRRKLGRSRNI